MGLMVDDDGNSAIITDILGTEDHIGDMDFKVAGSADGITAIQMDLKIDGLSYELLSEALEATRRLDCIYWEKWARLYLSQKKTQHMHLKSIKQNYVDKIGEFISLVERILKKQWNCTIARLILMMIVQC